MLNAGKALLRSNSCVLRQGLLADVRRLRSVTRDFASNYTYTMQSCTSVANEDNAFVTRNVCLFIYICNHAKERH